MSTFLYSIAHVLLSYCQIWCFGSWIKRRPDRLLSPRHHLWIRFRLLPSPGNRNRVSVTTSSRQTVRAYNWRAI